MERDRGLGFGICFGVERIVLFRGLSIVVFVFGSYLGRRLTYCNRLVERNVVILKGKGGGKD